MIWTPKLPCRSDSLAPMITLLAGLPSLAARDNHVVDDLIGHARAVRTSSEAEFVLRVGFATTPNDDGHVSRSRYTDYAFYISRGSYAMGFDPTWGIVYPWYPSVATTTLLDGTVAWTSLPTAVCEMCPQSADLEAPVT